MVRNANCSSQKLRGSGRGLSSSDFTFSVVSLHQRLEVGWGKKSEKKQQQRCHSIYLVTKTGLELFSHGRLLTGERLSSTAAFLESTEHRVDY